MFILTIMHTLKKKKKKKKKKTIKEKVESVCS